MQLTIHEFQEVDDSVRTDRTYTRDIDGKHLVDEIEKMFERFRAENIFFWKQENKIKYSKSDLMNMDVFAVTFPPEYSDKVEKYYIKRRSVHLRTRLKALKSDRKELKEQIRQVKNDLGKFKKAK